MTTFQMIGISILVLIFLYFFVISPIIAICELPGSIDRLTREVEELKEVLKNETKRKTNTGSV